MNADPMVRVSNFAIVRVAGGFAVIAVLDGHKFYCGADRRWVLAVNDIGNPFPRLRGAEWYLSEWV